MLPSEGITYDLCSFKGSSRALNRNAIRHERYFPYMKGDEAVEERSTLWLNSIILTLSVTSRPSDFVMIPRRKHSHHFSAVEAAKWPESGAEVCYRIDFIQPMGSIHGTFFLYSRYSEPKTFSKYTSSLITNIRNMRYMNIGVVSPIQLFPRTTIPGTIKTTHDAYKGWRQHH